MPRGRPKKYATEEEREEARQASMRKAQHIKDRSDCKNPCKKKIIDEKNGFKIRIETLNRARLDTIIVTFFANYKYVNNVDWYLFKKNVNASISGWLNQQEDWDRKNKIVIFELPDDSDYDGIYRSFEIQVYLKRLTPPKYSWKITVGEIMPFAVQVGETIKNTAAESGIEITYRYSYNRKMRPEGVELTHSSDVTSSDTAKKKSS